jgi:inner membrane protein
MWSSIFIIDPIYSLPLIGGVLAALLLRRTSLKGHTVNTICLVISTLYLAWSVGAKLHVNHIVTQSLERKAIAYERFLTVPAPFNTVLWRVLVMVGDGYYEGFYSLLDKTGDIPFTHYPSNGALLESLEEHWPVQRLQWFTHGFYSVKELDGAIVLSDLRMGLEPDYFFQFKVGEIGNPHPAPTQSARIRADRRLDRLAWVWKRIWDPGELSP